MKTTQALHSLGQSLWLDNITWEILTNGTLERYISDLSVTGLTSNPTIFEPPIPPESRWYLAVETSREAPGDMFAAGEESLLEDSRIYRLPSRAGAILLTH
jgi:transaldolase